MTTLPGQGPEPPRGWAPRGIDTKTPSTARMYDHYLGGKDNYPADREAADRVVAAYPEVRQLARNNRAFLTRAVRCLAEAGITQFIDVGTGIPTSPAVHEVARETHPDARVIYVDNDPIVLAHDRALLVADAGIATVDADMREPDRVLDDPQVGRLIDFDQPIGVLFVSVLHFAPGDEPKHIVARFRKAMTPGSYLAASLVTSEGMTRDQVAEGEANYADATSSVTIRSHPQVEEIFDGFDLLDPGLVDVSRWRADQPPTHWKILAGVATKR